MSICVKCCEDVAITFNDMCSGCADEEPGPPGRVSARDIEKSIDRKIRQHLHAASRKKQRRKTP